MAVEEPKRELLLTIVVPGFWADDIDENADRHFQGRKLDVLLDDQNVSQWVTVTLMHLGDEAGPMLHSFDCEIVDVATRDRK